MDIHQLARMDQAQVITTSCGQTRTKKSRDPMPADVTAWGGEVTCLACAPWLLARGSEAGGPTPPPATR